MTEYQSLLMRHIQAENAHDMAGTLATLHSECLFEDVALQEVYRGRAGAEVYYRTWWDAFDLRFRRGEGESPGMSVAGIHVAEGVFYGRHVGSFLGCAPTGREIEFRFVVLVNFRDGLMAGERFYYDSATLLRQIGGTAGRTT